MITLEATAHVKIALGLSYKSQGQRPSPLAKIEEILGSGWTVGPGAAPMLMKTDRRMGLNYIWAVVVPLAFVVPMIPFPVPAQPLSGEQVVEKMIGAFGGMEAWKRIKDLSFKMTVVSYDERGDVKGASVRLYYLQGYQKGRVESLEEGGLFVSGYDGRQAWAVSAGKAITQPEVLKAAQFQAVNWWYWMGVPFKLRDPGAIIAYKGEGSLQGRPVHLVEVSFSPGVGFTNDKYLYYVDPESAVIQAVEFWLQEGVWPGVGGRRFAFWSDYRSAGPFRRPHRITIYRDPEKGIKATELLLDGFKVNSGLDDRLFSEP